jgi:hypothetical protein
LRKVSLWETAVVAALAALLAAPAARCDSRDKGGANGSRPAKPLCGRLSEHGGLSVLELWGTPEEAGYAHGFLLAEEIVALFDGYVLDKKIVPNPLLYEAVLVPTVRRQFVWSPAHERELESLARGIRDRIGSENLRSKVLDRELKIEDLMVANALADWFGMMCSTVSAWGPLTADGQTITARTLDFPSTRLMEGAQLVVIRRGDGQTHPWMGVSWPGMIGVYTAMSSAGVTLLIHDAPGLKPSEVTGFTPRSLTLREALEKATAEDFVQDVQRVLQSRRVLVGNNIHASGPLVGERSPAVVFEYDANARHSGVTVRTPANTDDPIAGALWNTNHMRLRCPPRECWRYEQLGDQLREMAKNGRKLDPTSALALIGRVRQDTTLHSVCFVPHKKTMYVSILAISDKVVEFNLDEWLNRPTRDSDCSHASAAPADAPPPDKRRRDPSQGEPP